MFLVMPAFHIVLRLGKVGGGEGEKKHCFDFFVLLWFFSHFSSSSVRFCFSYLTFLPLIFTSKYAAVLSFKALYNAFIEESFQLTETQHYSEVMNGCERFL